jgi:hypothetical protein
MLPPSAMHRPPLDPVVWRIGGMVATTITTTTLIHHTGDDSTNV